MYVNITALQSFYESLLGKRVQKTIKTALERYHCFTSGGKVMGLGYAVPYLDLFIQKAECCFAFMPARQGASLWPAVDAVATALVFEEDLPLPDASIDCVIMIHALEYIENAKKSMQELWRVLVPNGRLILIVTNRQGLWAHLKFTPFGNGTSYSHSQLSNLLKETGFLCGPIKETLHFLPCRNGHFESFLPFYEKIFQRFFPYFGGVLIVEAHKQLYKSLSIVKRNSQCTFSPVFQPQ